MGEKLTYSVVIRCRNEERDLGDCLIMLMGQSVPPSKVVLVDNNSTDRSKEIASCFGCEIVGYPNNVDFNYSRALNLGIERTTTDFILFLSAHCILHNNNSIQYFLDELCDNKTAGVFGRQIPTKHSNYYDIRDLLTVFGRERIVYTKYPFFHNAFSMISRSCYEKYKFNEKLNGVEDRDWANEMINLGYKIVYCPEAVVYHEHGLNNGILLERAKRVCENLSKIHSNDIIEFPNFEII